MTIYTIGHSTRSLDEFLALLSAYHIDQLGDVRTVPKSRRHPHFAGESLDRSLSSHGVAYRHFPGLGGLRKPRADSRNTAWRTEGFRGFADHMETPMFDHALDELMGWAEGRRCTVIMCAEAVWWRCHRQLIADALTARRVEVRHISSERSAPVHTLTAFARLIDHRVQYPGLDSLTG